MAKEDSLEPLADAESIGVARSVGSYLYISYRVIMPFGNRGGLHETFTEELDTAKDLGLMYSAPLGTTKERKI